MIRSHFGIELNPFDLDTKTALLAHQQEVFDTIKVHCQQGGLCLVLGEPGTGKSVLKSALLHHDTKRMITPAIARTLHSYTNILHILCDAFGIDAAGRDAACEKRLIEAARKINLDGRMLVPIIDDAHLLRIDCLRRLRLLMEDFPKNHNLVLFAQPALLHQLQLSVNQDIRSRVTYSARLAPLAPDDITAFLLAQLDRVGLGHNTISEDALALIARSSEGFLRRTRNLAIGALIEAVRDRQRCVNLDHVNRCLLQPHWRLDHDLDPR